MKIVRGAGGAEKYRQITNILRERILRGQYKPGEKIPSYPQLCKIFDVSETTIRQAVGILAAENLLRRERGRGKGVFINPPEMFSGSGKPHLRNLSIWSARNFDSPYSDDPAIQRGIMASINADSASVALMPYRQQDTDMLNHVKAMMNVNPPDGILINGQIFWSDSDAEEAVKWLNEKGVKYVLIFSAECTWSESLLKVRHPGVYMYEQGALTKAMAIALKKERKKLLFLGTDEFSVTRSMRVAEKSPLAAFFKIESLVFDEVDRKNLYKSMEQVLLNAAKTPDVTIVMEGSNVPLSYFDAVVSAHNMKCGTDISMVFFEHYCDLNSVFAAKYSSITRPYFQLGKTAGEMLQKMLESSESGSIISMDAAFGDLGTI